MGHFLVTLKAALTHIHAKQTTKSPPIHLSFKRILPDAIAAPPGWNIPAARWFRERFVCPCEKKRSAQSLFFPWHSHHANYSREKLSRSHTLSPECSIQFSIETRWIMDFWSTSALCKQKLEKSGGAKDFLIFSHLFFSARAGPRKIIFARVSFCEICANCSSKWDDVSHSHTRAGWDARSHRACRGIICVICESPRASSRIRSC